MTSSFGEFDLINRYFSQQDPQRADTLLGIGDDCALLQPPVDRCLAVSTDTLVEGVHFHKGADPFSLGHKALAVNLSDLAAMGAQPAWVTLALTIPSIEEDWLAAFASGFLTLAKTHNVQLVGGDTTQGPRTITVQVIGFSSHGQAIKRSGAKSGDMIYVTGTLGDAALAFLAETGRFNVPQNQLRDLQERLHRPQPRLIQGRDLRNIASATIDISDGLAADLGHILQASKVGASIDSRMLPLSDAVKNYITLTNDLTLPLTFGDDYELCFTVPPDKIRALDQLATTWECGCCCIGQIEKTQGLHYQHNDHTINIDNPGYQHFTNTI